VYPTQEDYEYVVRVQYEQIRRLGAGCVETRWQRKDGVVIDVLLSSAAMIPGDLSAGVTFTALDITQRKQSEQASRNFSHELLAAREEEKKSISGVLHHEVGSVAVGLVSRLDEVERQVLRGQTEHALRQVRECRTLLESSLARLKNLAGELRPPDLDILGLPAALREYLSQVRKHTSLKVCFVCKADREKVSGDAGTVLFRIVQEAVTNTVKHANATTVSVRLDVLRKGVKLTVTDDGHGFDLDKAPARRTAHIGLRAMQEMAAAQGGTFDVQSGPHKGTRITALLPPAGE